MFASNGEPIEALEVSGLHGNRIHKFQAPADNLQVSYTATIVGKTDRAPVTEYDLTMYLWPNRYAESDKFYGFAATEFGDYADSTTLLENVSLWVGTRLIYVPGSSDPIDGAVDTLLAGNGVCRDYAHRGGPDPARGARTSVGASPLAVRAWGRGAARTRASRHERRRPTRDGHGRMRMAFLVNRVETEIDEYATTRLAKAAALMGHEVWYIGLGDVRIGEPDGEIGAHARLGIARDDDTLTAFVDRMKESSAERIRLDKLDAAFLRNDSIEDLQDRAWASSLGAMFGELLVAHGVTVVNDPTVLMRAATKVYLDEFPAEIRPRSLLTRNEEDVRNFISSVGRCIIKPLHGAKGRNVFMVDGDDEPNLNQIMEAVLEDGYIYAQGYVDGAEEGDMRIFLLDGDLIEVDGHVAAFRRVPEGNDPRANISTGGRMQPGGITETTRAVVEAMRDKLVQDGMFFVGIDVIGDKVLEINAESPGGLQAIERLYEVDICPVVIDALERRTRSGPGTPQLRHANHHRAGVQPAAATPTANG